MGHADVRTIAWFKLGQLKRKQPLAFQLDHHRQPVEVSDDLALGHTRHLDAGRLPNCLTERVRGAGKAPGLCSTN